MVSLKITFTNLTRALIKQMIKSSSAIFVSCAQQVFFDFQVKLSACLRGDLKSKGGKFKFQKRQQTVLQKKVSQQTFETEIKSRQTTQTSIKSFFSNQNH